MNMAAFWGAFLGMMTYDLLKELWKWVRKDDDDR